MKDFFNFDRFFNLFDNEFNSINSPFKSIDSFMEGNYKKTTKKIELPSGTCIVISYTLNVSDDGVEVSDLKSQLDEAVKNQEYEKAAELRDQIKELEITQNKINDLNAELEKAVKNQEYEKAAELRDQIKNLKK